MKTLASVTLLLLAATFYSTTAFGNEIEINGLHLGMAKSEVEKKFGALPLNDFKIANVPGRFPVRLAFYDGKLDELMFFFSPEGFNDVRKAVISKNPQIACTDSTITSPRGESYTQVNCKLVDKLGTLKLDRYVRDINTSGLTLTSHRLFQELETERKEKQKGTTDK